MPSESLYAPWRMDYIRSLAKAPADACFLCTAAAAADPADPARQADPLVLWTTAHSLVILNRFPYTSGHLLVAPRAHLADLEEFSADQALDMQLQTVAAVRLLKRALSPQGFNIGINLGRPAGAGLPGHLHQHVVPRWSGDTNFMGVVANARIVPQAVTQTHAELARVAKELGLTP